MIMLLRIIISWFWVDFLFIVWYIVCFHIISLSTVTLWFIVFYLIALSAYTHVMLFDHLFLHLYCVLYDLNITKEYQNCIHYYHDVFSMFPFLGGILAYCESPDLQALWWNATSESDSIESTCTLRAIVE